MITYKKLTRAIFLLVLFSCTLKLAAFGQSSPATQQISLTSTIDTDKYSVGVPAGWIHQNRPAGSFQALYIIGKRSDNFTPSINIVTAPVGNISLDEFASGNMESMKEANMKPDSLTDFEISGLHGRFYITKVPHENIVIVLKSYMVLKDGVGYVLTGGYLAGKKETYEPIFDAVVKSFKIK